MARPCCAALLSLTILVGAARVAHAQEPSAAALSEARELFQAGVAATEEERWEDAHRDFSRSYELAPRPNTRLNLAAAQASLGQLVAAAESYRAFLEEATGRYARHRASAQAALEEVEARTPRLTITVPELRSGDQLEVDGAPLSVAYYGLPMPIDPGPHVIRVEREGAVVGLLELSLDPAEERSVSLALHEVAAPELPEVTLEPDDAGGDDPTIFWGLGIGGGVLVVGLVLGVVLGVALTNGGYVGNVGPGRIGFE